MHWRPTSTRWWAPGSRRRARPTGSRESSAACSTSMPRAAFGPAVALRPQGMALLIGEVEEGRVSGTNAKAVLAAVFESGEDPRAVIEREGLGQVNDGEAIGREIEAVIDEYPGQVAEYRAGKPQLFGFLVGQVMKRTAGRADAKLITAELRRRLDAE